VVEADDDVAARAEAAEDRREPAARITSVVQDTVGDDDVERLGPEGRPEEVHLHERHTTDVMCLLEAVRERERVDAHIGAEHRSTPREAEVVAELAGSTSGLKHPGAVGDFLIEKA